MGKQYTIGVDFGTLSARAVLVDISDGTVIADSVFEYPYGVMDTYLLPYNIALQKDFALQNPKDYLDAFAYTVSSVLATDGVSPKEVIGIGIDFTCCTVLPVKKDGTPLCFDEKFKKNPHAYVKLWKHHAAQPYADKLNKVLSQCNKELLDSLGSCTSSEWMFPKIMETLDKAPEVYENAAYFIEAADFITWMLTGKQTRSYVFASYKALYNEKFGGYPSEEILCKLDERLKNVVKEKLSAKMIRTCQCAGETDKDSKLRFNVPCNAPWLMEGTKVACPEPDAHSAAPALGMSKSGDMFAIFGTSSNYMLLSDEYKIIKGICGVVKDGLIPGFNAYESGLCCFGDHFAWVAENICTEKYAEQAKKENKSIIEYISQKAQALAPGESGILALNWFNGNRNILVDSSLSGMFLGLTLQTKPEDLFRAIVEANAFGTRVIIENFEKNGVCVKSMAAAGGITRKSPFVMQTLADILGKELRVSGYIHSSALGSAIYASVASGGHKNLYDAIEKMADKCEKVYYPDLNAKKIYDELYKEYLKLHDYFGKGENDVMKHLRKISSDAICGGTK